MRFAPRAKKPLSVNEKKLRGRTFKYLSRWDGIYNKWGWADKPEKEKEELRHSINVDLFGRYTPPSRLTNEQFSVMRYALELLYNEGILVWSAEMAELAREEGLRRVYAWWIEHAGLDTWRALRSTAHRRNTLQPSPATVSEVWPTGARSTHTASGSYSLR